jgi:hypothetical protein
MPKKPMFDPNDSQNQLIRILNLLTQTLTNASQVKTVEEIQDIIFNFNLILQDIKKQIK